MVVRPQLIFSSLTGVLFLVAIGLTCYHLFDLCQSTQTEYELKVNELRQARAENRRLQERINQLQALERHLQTDEGVEEIARDKLGLARPNEMSFTVVPPPPARTVYQTYVPEEPEPEPVDEGTVANVLRHLFTRGPTTAK